MPVLPDDTESVIDSRGSCVSHSLDSIVLDHRSFMEAGGDLKRTKRVLFSSGLMYSHKDLTKKLKVTSKIQFQSVGPLNNNLFSSLQLHQASSAPPKGLVHLLLPHLTATMSIMLNGRIDASFT